MYCQNYVFFRKIYAKFSQLIHLMSKSGPPIFFMFTPFNINSNQNVNKNQIFHFKNTKIFYDENFRNFFFNQKKDDFNEEGDFGFIKSNYVHICDIEKVHSAHDFVDLIELSETESIIIKDEKNSDFNNYDYEDETEMYFNSVDSVSFSN